VLRPAAGKEPGGLQAQLEVELERAMLEAGRTKRSSAPPTGVANRVNDLTLSAGSDGFLLEWTYVNDADYDRNGVVSISDLTPIGLGFGKQNSDPAWENFRVADGDGNGEINLADVTPVGRNFGNNISHWMLQNSFTGTSGWVDNGMLEPELPQARIGIVLHEPLEQWYRIVPVDAEGFRGEPSNATRLDVNGPTVVAVSGNSGL
ncbi:hypothetical protein KDL30_16490, partial [bacterium]|nr:hypothetical protein [bacterium]